jgi:hypothetical protein
MTLDSSNLDPVAHVLFFHRTVVLQHTGVLEEFPSLSEQQSDMYHGMKAIFMKRAEGFHVEVSRRLNSQTLQKFAADEKSVTLGAAGGAILGFLF